MNWILYVFRHNRGIYLVPAESINDAWNKLAKRQSMCLERCNKMYTFVTEITKYCEIYKIKL